jgi:gamma-glutamylcyclotransferase (GGCT)/AIG2-like uncharacterized protein YtfP
MLHFAYGSNMSRTLMRPRCAGAREVGPAVLDDHRVMISTDGYATVVPAAGERVHGIVWRLTTRDLAALNNYERVDAGLFHAETMPVRCGARRMAALVYVGRSRKAGRPRPGYLDLVVDAAVDVGLPPDYVRKLSRLAPSGWRAPRVPEMGELA